MLGKLFKHEWKATARLLLLLYLAVPALFLAGWLIRLIGNELLTLFPAVLLICAGVAVFFLTFAFLILRFHKSMFGSEGYLTQTLPVRKGRLLFVKLCTAFLWVLLSLAAALLAVGLGLWLADVNLIDAASQLLAMIRAQMPEHVYRFMIGLTIGSSAVGMLGFLIEVFFAVTLANTGPFLKNNIVFSFLFYFAAAVGMNVVNSLLTTFFPFSIRFTEEGMSLAAENMLGMMAESFQAPSSAALPASGSMNIGLAGFLFQLAALIAMVVLTNWLLREKTSVK